MIFGDLDSILAARFESKELQGLENQRFMPPFELILSSTNGLSKEGLAELQDSSNIMRYVGEIAGIYREYEDTHIDCEPPMFAFCTNLGRQLVFFEEISGEQIIT